MFVLALPHVVAAAAKALGKVSIWVNMLVMS